MARIVSPTMVAPAKNGDEARASDVLDKRIKRLRKKKWIVALVGSLVATGAVVYVLFGVIFGITIVNGSSMTPALYSGDMAVFYRLGEYKQGDIVLINTGNGKADYIKRIVGMPGDEIDINEQKGQVLINGEAYPESYIYEETHANRESSVKYPVRLGTNEYFVLGDERGNSSDSRNYGAIPREELEGSVIAVLRTGG